LLRPAARSFSPAFSPASTRSSQTSFCIHRAAGDTCAFQ
jgi:hypothetical protein